MIEIENGSTNVYEDLGLPDAAEMKVKAVLAAKIGEIIKHRHLTQTEAAWTICLPAKRPSSKSPSLWPACGTSTALQ